MDKPSEHTYIAIKGRNAYISTNDRSHIAHFSIHFRADIISRKRAILYRKAIIIAEILPIHYNE